MSVTSNGRVICDDCGLFVKSADAGFRYGFTVGSEPPEENYHRNGCPKKKGGKK